MINKYQAVLLCLLLMSAFSMQLTNKNKKEKSSPPASSI